MKLSDLVEKLNDLFDDGTLTDADLVGMFEHVAAKMMENEALVQRSTVNIRDQFKLSPALQRIGEDAAIEAMVSYK